MKLTTYKFPTEWKSIGILCLISFTLLGLRIKISQDFFLLFLVWNLFLALIPYLITYFLYDTYTKGKGSPKISKIKLIIGGFIWLAFLPNAPYIITDLIHIRHLSGAIKAYEALLISSFAVTGVYFGFLSLRHYSTLLVKCGWINSRGWQLTFEYLILLLSSYGIYLGRVLRYNSWDIMYNMERLLIDCWTLCSEPFVHIYAWIFISGMGVFLIFAFHIFNIYNPNSSNDAVA